MRSKTSSDPYQCDQGNSFLILDTLSLAYDIERVFGNDFIEPPQGVYNHIEIEPVLKPGVSYRIPFAQDSEAPTADTVIERMNGAVYDLHGKCVIPSSMVAQKKKLLSYKPMLPYFGLKIIKLLVDAEIDSIVLWRKHAGNNWSKIQQFLQPQTHEMWSHEVIEKYLEEHMQYLYEQLQPIIANHRWNVYFVKQKGSKLTIERGEDFRILQWTEMHEKGLIKL